MSAYVFPALPGAVWGARETIRRVVVEEALSGREDRTILSGTPRYLYPCTQEVLRSSVAAPSPWGAYSEVAVVQFFIDAHYGSGDSFHIVDPYDGTTDRVVRFADPSVRLERIVSGLWRCQFDLISVI